MEIEIFLTQNPIARPQTWTAPFGAETGSLVEFYGIVRETEGAQFPHELADSHVSIEAHFQDLVRWELVFDGSDYRRVLR